MAITLRFFLFLSLSMTLPANAETTKVLQAGLYSGSNQNALLFKKCGIEVFRDNGQLVLISVKDSSNVYNFWMEGKEAATLNKEGTSFLSSGTIYFNHYNSNSKTTIFSTEPKSQKQETYILKVETNEGGKITSFDLLVKNSYHRIFCKNILEK